MLILLFLNLLIENKRAVQDAKLEFKKSKRKDYYKILGVAKDVSDDQLKKAYRKRAMLHHPGQYHISSLIHILC